MTETEMLEDMQQRLSFAEFEWSRAIEHAKEMKEFILRNGPYSAAETGRALRLIGDLPYYLPEVEETLRYHLCRPPL
jgi:hypothetical protein